MIRRSFEETGVKIDVETTARQVFTRRTAISARPQSSASPTSRLLLKSAKRIWASGSAGGIGPRFVRNLPRANRRALLHITNFGEPASRTCATAKEGRSDHGPRFSLALEATKSVLSRKSIPCAKRAEKSSSKELCVGQIGNSAADS